MRTRFNLLMVLLVLTAGSLQAQVVSNVAGTPGVFGSSNGTAASASFNNPHSIAIDRLGNIYVADRFGHKIRKITPGGVVSTFAGSGSVGATDGTGTAASFNEPWAITIDTIGNLYVADTKNYKIRKITAGGVVTTVAGTGTFGVTNGHASVAQFGFPSGVAVNKNGSVIYVADRMTNTIRRIQNDTVITFAGTVFSPGSNDGQGIQAKFDHPYGIALDDAGNVLVADEFNNKIRKITPSGLVSTIAGNGTQGSSDGPALSSSFNAPWGVCVMNNGDILIGDANNFTVRKLSQGTVSVYAGQSGNPGMVNGPALQSTFNGVSALFAHPSENAVYLTDPYSHLVRKIESESLTLTTSSGATSFCTGSPVTLIATPSGLSNYVFRNGATVIGNSSTGVLTLSTLPQGTNNITCTATNAQGLTIPSNILQVEITAGLQVTVSVSGNTTICQGDTVTLTASPTGTYQWSNGQTTSSILVTAAGNYTVTVTNAQNCSGVSTPVEIITLQPPSATVAASISTPACVGDSVILTAGQASSYQWSNGQTTQSISVSAPGNYTVLVTNNAGCSAISLPINVPFYTQSTATVSPSGNVLITQGSSVTLQAGPATAYSWSTGAITQSITVSQPGSYTVTVTDSTGCVSLPATVQVNYINPSNIISLAGASAFCAGDSVLMTSVFTTGNQWYYNGNPVSGATQQNYYASSNGSYHVEHTASPGNIVVSDPVNITVYPSPALAIATADSVCRDNQATLSVLPQQGVTFNWYDEAVGGNLVTTGLSMVTPPLPDSEEYYVESISTYGCLSPGRTQVTAYVYAKPLVEIIHNGPSLINGSYEVTFAVQGAGIQSYYWDFGEPSSPDNTANTPDPYHAYTTPGEYTVTLEIVTADGCSETYSKVLKVSIPNNLFIPTGFTPNSDGNNDIFRVRGHNILFYDMSIFNQWGQRIWHSPNETTGWDGTTNGEKVPVGSYAYVIEVHFDDGKKEMHRGNINLIR